MADKSAIARTVPANPTEHLRAAIEAIKKQGPCAMCGGPYAAHRQSDSEVGLFMAGDTLEAVADFMEAKSVDEMLMRWLAVFISQAEAEARTRNDRNR